ncbi:hypothetical protein [Lederbergia panacisoli]|uniref:hypothetical protein n=1 Tax=Lederbergia panacisoli TaxID=1255251 RepID=UPI00214B88DB|nr:hypothetical protein [Lederbergia panacisoli]MCR2821298.1 hypothetical protein [Lederbergia panacisoli]
MKKLMWIIPNVFCYIMFVAVIIFIVRNEEGLLENNDLFIWGIMGLILLLVSMFGSFRIWRWIKEGEI